jgi:hypothetical protein
VAWLAWPSFREPPRIKHVEIEHFREESKTKILEFTPIGTAGSKPALLGDWVRVAAKFEGPSYCYLIAFNPNGSEQLCYPYKEHADQPPAELSELTYPRGTSYFPLTDGVGLQVFVLLASRRPLPVYAEWRRRTGPIPWRAVTGEVGWRYNGVVYKPLDSGLRGQERQMPVPPEFEALCRYLKEQSSVEAIEAVAIPVHAKEAKQGE